MMNLADARGFLHFCSSVVGYDRNEDEPIGLHFLLQCFSGTLIPAQPNYSAPRARKLGRCSMLLRDFHHPQICGAKCSVRVEFPPERKIPIHQITERTPVLRPERLTPRSGDTSECGHPLVHFSISKIVPLPNIVMRRARIRRICEVRQPERWKVTGGQFFIVPVTDGCGRCEDQKGARQRGAELTQPNQQLFVIIEAAGARCPGTESLPL